MEACVKKSVQRDERIDLLKGIAILLVVLGHMKQLEGVHNFIYSFHMLLFAFLGGCTFQYSFVNRSERMGSPAKVAVSLVKDRIITLLIPYVCWSVIVSYIAETSFAEAMDNYWFLPMLFGVTVAATLILTVCKTGKTNKTGGGGDMLLCIFTILCTAAFSFALFKITGLRTFRQMAIYSIPFCLGVFVKKSTKWERVFTSSLVSTVAILCYCLLLPLYSASDKSLAVLVVRFACGISFTQVLYTFVSALSKKADGWWSSENTLKKGLLWFGENSLSIYMIHTFFRPLFNRAILGGTAFYDTLIQLVGAIVVCSLSILIADILKTSKIFDFLLFGHIAKKSGGKTNIKAKVEITQ